ncbi:DUF4157 domain-containing protein [Streptomyces sp. NPDC048664]|uniref:eCIS core domain-containing protein n=1 Tax=Streptomyces sp. NPDC048664 TaxID=3154505 RepID=UPI00342B735D
MLDLQRAAGNAAVARAVAEERHVHSAGCGHGSATTGSRPSASVQRSAVHEVLRAPGRQLDAPLKQEMEGRFGGEDFSGVQLHSDSAALRSAAEIGAEAYTSFPHVVWDGRDKTVLAEELHHIRQQRSGPVPGTNNGSGLSISDPGDWAEVEARSVARDVMSGAAPVQRSAVAEAETPAVATSGAREGVSVVQRSPAAGSSKVTKSKGRGGSKASSSGRKPSEAVRDELVALGWEFHGANQSLTLHLPQGPQEGQAGATTDASKKGQIYSGSANVVGKRSYEGERTKQVLRWISTAVFRSLNAAGHRPEEVQAAMSREEGTEQGQDQGSEQDVTMEGMEQTLRLYVSSNKTRTNNIIRGEAGDGAASAYVSGLLETMVPDSAREKRHKKKLAALLAQEAGQVPNDFWDVVQALAGPMVVPTPTTDGKHAERTIMGAAPQGSIDRDEVAGVKRPCVSCFMDLYQGTTRHPGPYWPSNAANVDVPDYSVAGARGLARKIHDAITAAGGTFVTLDCDERHTVAWDRDTSSDSSGPSSESESEEVAMSTTS